MNNTAQIENDVIPAEPSLFSVEEFDSFYLVSVDLPSLPIDAPEIVRSGKEISIQSSRKKIFRLKASGACPKASYEDGSLWLLLPKNKKENAAAMLLASSLE